MLTSPVTAVQAMLIALVTDLQQEIMAIIEQQVQGIHYLQAQIRKALIKDPELVLRTNHKEQIPARGRATHHHEVVLAIGRATHHHAVPVAVRQGVTLRQSLRLQEAQAQDHPVAVAEALQAKGNNR